MNSNKTMLTDLYQLTMAYGYFKRGKHNDHAVFDLFYRKHAESPFVIFAGLEQVLEYIKDIQFTNDDINYLKSLKLFDGEFLDYLKNFRFSGKIYSMDEGTIAFPHEPMMRIEGGLLETQLIETTLLNIINHQTLIATKANRIVRAASPGVVSDFGLRRAQGGDAGLYGARAAFIGGCVSTSNVLAGKQFGIPISGTHAHSWVMSFDSELEAFRTYAAEFPKNCILLVDTYDVLKSGVPNAITVFKEEEQKGNRPTGIRLDSGDLAYLSKKARKMLDQNGLDYVKIFATNDLDEYTIQSLTLQGAKIDVYGVGTKMITSYNMPALGGVYKLAELDHKPKMKLSENIEKITNPCKKTVFRLFDKDTGKAVADLITLFDEVFAKDAPLTIYHSLAVWKKLVLENVNYKELLSLYYDNGAVKSLPTIREMQAHTAAEVGSFWEEYLRIDNPQDYRVDLSDKLYDLKKGLVLKIIQS